MSSSSSKSSSSSSTSSSSNNAPRRRRKTKKAWQAVVRESVTPYLPPPVVNLWHRADRQLDEWLGLGEGGGSTFITILSTVWMSWLVAVLIIRWTTQRGSSSSSSLRGGGGGGGIKAIQEDEEDDENIIARRHLQHQQAKFDSTVVLCGPPQSGKTCLFYQLCYYSDKTYSQIPTVTSMKANVGVNNKNGIRYIDWPGHRSTLTAAASNGGTDDSSSFLENERGSGILAKAWKDSIKKMKHNSVERIRLVLVLDATQPVKEAAAILYQIWFSVATAATTTTKQTKNKFPVVICCHKQDFPKCKNARRIRIQLRTELEKLITVRQPTWLQGTTAAAAASAGKGGSSVELDDTNLPYLQLVFLETSSEKLDSLQPLQLYCTTGELPPE